MELSPESSVGGYRLVRRLGEGGQGAVWLVEDPAEPDHPCAVKLVRLVLSRPKDVERIRREARLLARLSHPSIPTCRRLFEEFRGEVLGFAMEYVEGISLAEAVDDERWTDRHRQMLLEHLLQALAYIHQRGAVHRDVKPQNVLLRQRFWEEPEEPSAVKLVDFGIAALPGTEAGLTATDHVIGTAEYIAPELLEPKVWGATGATPSVDVFAFGVVAHKLLSGAHPTRLEGTSTLCEYMEAYRHAQDAEVPWPDEVPDGMPSDVLRRCLAPRASDRYPDAGAVLKAFGEDVSEPESHESSTEEHASPRSAPRQGRTSEQYSQVLGADVDDARPSEPVQPGPRSKVSAPPSSRIKRRRSLAFGVILGAVGVSGAIAVASTLLAPPNQPAVAPSAVVSSVRRAEAPSPVVAATRSGEAVALPSASTSGSAPATDAGLTLAAPAPRLPSWVLDPCKVDQPLCTRGCCPTNRHCGGACEESLPSGSWDLRLFGVLDENLAPRGQGIRVYLTVRGTDVERQPLHHGGLVIATTEHLQRPVFVDIQRPGRDTFSCGAFLSAKLDRARLCRGLQYDLGEPCSKWRYARLWLYLDPHGEAPPSRCMKAEDGSPYFAPLEMPAW